MKRARYIGAFGVFVLVLAFAVPAFAADNAGERLAEGIKEVAEAPAAVPAEIAETTQETNNPIKGIAVGAVEGAGYAVGKVAEGTVKAATFYIPEKGANEEGPEEPVIEEAEENMDEPEAYEGVEEEMPASEEEQAPLE